MAISGISGKVKGRTVEVTVEGVMSVFQRRTREMLDKHGITDPDPQPDGWYELADFMEVLQDVQNDAGANALGKIGEATPRHVGWPDGVSDPVSALESLSTVYDDQHRDAPGGYETEVVDDATVRVTADTPYPCTFDTGLLKGTPEEFGASFARVNEVGDRCREDGADACVYEISV